MTAPSTTRRAAGVTALSVETTPLDDVRQLIPFIDSRRPLVWLRKGEGIAGIGEALRLDFTGPDRIREAAETWRATVAAATVTDRVRTPGTGLVAFGTFAFADDSATTSTLIVPELVLGRRDGRSWLTRIRPIGESAGDGRDGESAQVEEAQSGEGAQRTRDDAAGGSAGIGETASSAQANEAAESAQASKTASSTQTNEPSSSTEPNGMASNTQPNGTASSAQTGQAAESTQAGRPGQRTADVRVSAPSTHPDRIGSSAPSGRGVEAGGTGGRARIGEGDGHPLGTAAGARTGQTVLSPRVHGTADSARADAAAPGAPRPTAFGDEYRLSLLPGSLSKDGYRAAVAAAVGRIREHGLAKVVLARDLSGHLPLESDVRRALVELALGYPDCWTFAVDGLIGSSPETLVRVHHGTVTARVLAGTVSRGRDAAGDHEAAVALATSTKDQDEHRFAVASVLDALRPHSDDLAASDLPFTLKLPNLWHLATDIAGSLSDGSGSLDLADALHPTAAVAGTPTEDALALIRELEPFDRGRYAGPVGWVDGNGDGEWAIALRCAQLGETGDLTAYAGAGIVADSDPDRELAETTMKFRPIVEAFG